MNRKKLQKLTDTLTKNCKHFDKFEVKCLITLFYNLVGDVAERPGVVTGLDRNVFRNILHVTFGMTDDMIMDRVFRGFDKDNDGCISVSEWIHGLSLFLRENLLLEAFGPCLPDPKSQMEFEAQVFKDPNEFNDM